MQLQNVVVVFIYMLPIYFRQLISSTDFIIWSQPQRVWTTLSPWIYHLVLLALHSFFRGSSNV